MRLCSKPYLGPGGCGRPAVVAGIRCREHLLEELRAKRRPIPYDEPELAELYAVAVHLIDVNLKEALADLRRQPDGLTQVALCAVIKSGTDWKQARTGLEALRRRLSEVPPFRDVALEAVGYGIGPSLYRLRLSAPGWTPQELRARLLWPMDVMIMETTGEFPARSWIEES